MPYSLSPPAAGAVADHGQVGEHPQVEEEAAADDVGRDGGHVPQQGRAEVGPEPALVGIGDHVEEGPVAPQVDQREEAGHGDAEDGHRLGGAQDRSAPVGLGEAQDRGDHGAGVGQADPEDEAGDVEAPHDRAVLAGHVHAVHHLPGEGGQPPGHHRPQAEGESVPAQGRGAQGGEQLVVDLVSALLVAVGPWLSIRHARVLLP